MSPIVSHTRAYPFDVSHNHAHSSGVSCLLLSHTIRCLAYPSASHIQVLFIQASHIIMLIRSVSCLRVSHIIMRIHSVSCLRVSHISKCPFIQASHISMPIHRCHVSDCLTYHCLFIRCLISKCLTIHCPISKKR